MSRWGRSGIVNVRMVITEEKILSNIDKIHRIINPNSKKQIIELEEDSYFKDLIESVKTYLIEYPKKKNFPVSVYKAAYELVEYATNQFEENTKQIEELIRQREKNISLAGVLKNTLGAVENKESGWKDRIKEISNDFQGDIIDTLGQIGRLKTKDSQNYQEAVKLINSKINNLEVNLHIEIDMERIEDRSKALSYIGIEVAEALKLIPKPEEEIQEVEEFEAIEEQEMEEYFEETRVSVKQSIWSKFKSSKLVRAIKYVFQIRVVLELPALPEGRGEF
ncbi:MAG: hypothetical protein Q4G05_01190 [Clostridia bacterium]|nr:hypothetical protein [Clostridia bacterium]